jgi:hypothetical protein
VDFPTRILAKPNPFHLHQFKPARMSNFAPPVRRGDFLYSSILYADAGNNNEHPRASVAEIAGILRPEAVNLYTRSNVPAASAPAKDQVWHWWAAQLIHYGLPVTKEKSKAKIRLLDALNQFKLEVPAWILGLEGELRKEWERENARLKRGGKAVKENNAEPVRASKKVGKKTAGVSAEQMGSQGFSVNGKSATQRL